MCWPQTGHANLNSLIASKATIPQAAGHDNSFLAVTFSAGRRTVGGSEAHE
jgi:hypothetical protein